MNFANFIPAILGILGLHTFNKVDGKPGLTDEEYAKLKGYGFSDAFLADFKAHLSKPEDPEGDASTSAAAVAAVLGKVTSQHEAVSAELAALKQSANADKEAHAAAIASKEAEIANLNEKIAALSALPEPDAKTTGGNAGVVVDFNLDDTKQLGGMQGEHFSLDRAYNKRARAAMLAARGMEVMGVASPNSVDYKNLQDDLGAFYRSPWTQRLQSFLVALPTITRIFPTEPGHQDLDTLVNIWLGEFSQPDNSGESDFEKVVKGSFEFGTETLRMYDVMFAHKFKSLKTIEKSWIAYLNREGSNPVKLSFIEFLLVEVSKALHNEQQLRFVNGVRKDPKVDEPGRAMAAADGIYEYLRKRIDGHIDFTPNGGTSGKTVYQIKPFELPKITPGNIGEVFYLGTQMIPSHIRDTGKAVLYVPSWMIPLYHKYNEAHYGQNIDYKAGITYVKEFPSVRIEAIPNADNHHRIFWTIEGNIKTYTFVDGEMLRYNIEQQDWSLKVWSNWKESIAAEAVGYKYTRKADMDGSRQLIWCNDYDRPDTYFVDGEKDANPSALLHSSVVTVANSSIYNITDIVDAEVGKIISIKCGVDGDYGVTIKAEGKFSLLSEAWTPAKGDVLKVMKRADGKFIEIERTTSVSESYQFPANETAPSVQGATVFVTNENTQATALTDLANAVPGVVYTIHGSGDANATTIANGGNFALTKTMTLKQGAWIKLVKSGNKIYEVARN